MPDATAPRKPFAPIPFPGGPYGAEHLGRARPWPAGLAAAPDAASAESLGCLRGKLAADLRAVGVDSLAAVSRHTAKEIVEKLRGVDPTGAPSVLTEVHEALRAYGLSFAVPYTGPQTVGGWLPPGRLELFLETMETLRDADTAAAIDKEWSVFCAGLPGWVDRAGHARMVAACIEYHVQQAKDREFDGRERAFWGVVAEIRSAAVSFLPDGADGPAPDSFSRPGW